MIKGAKRKRKTSSAESEIEQYIKAVDAKRLFINSTLSMSWRLALTVVIPTVAGVQLDKRLGTTPSLTIIGIFLAAVGASATVWNAVKEINAMQAEDEKESKQK